MSRQPDPVDIHIGQRLHHRRQLLGISQRALGERVGVRFQQIQKYERGTNRTSGSRLHALALALGVQPGFFYEGLKDKLGQSEVSLPTPGELAAAEEKTRLLETIEALPSSALESGAVTLILAAAGKTE